MACNESTRVNVGDPDRSQMDQSIEEQDSKSRTSRSLSGSQMCRSTRSLGELSTWGRTLGK